LTVSVNQEQSMCGCPLNITSPSVGKVPILSKQRAGELLTRVEGLGKWGAITLRANPRM